MTWHMGGLLVTPTIEVLTNCSSVRARLSKNCNTASTFGKNGKTYFNLLATNGEIILTSQMYASNATAKKGIASVQTNAASGAQFEEKQNVKGKYYFVLRLFGTISGQKGHFGKQREPLGNLNNKA